MHKCVIRNIKKYLKSMSSEPSNSSSTLMPREKTKFKLEGSVSYAILLVICCWALHQNCCHLNGGYCMFSNVAFTIIAVYAILGCLKCNQVSKTHTCLDSFASVYKYFCFLTNIYPIPLICVELYTFITSNLGIAYLHLIYPLIALLTFVRHEKNKPNIFLVGIVNGISLMSLTLVSAVGQNGYGFCAALVNGSAHYFTTPVGIFRRHRNNHLQDSKNYLLAVFVGLSQQALMVSVDCYKEKTARNAIHETVDDCSIGCYIGNGLK